MLGDLGADEYLAGVDLDSCLDPDASLATWAEPLLAALDTYAERSPSGAGIKALFCVEREDVRPFLALLGVSDPDQWGIKRSVGNNGGDHGPGIEIYCARRYFTITGELWPGKPRGIHLLEWAALERLAALVPKPQNSRAGAPGRDTSRSAKALREGARLRREGKTFEEMCEALRNHADPDIAAWCREKGGERQLCRIWEKAAPTEKMPAEFSEDDLALRFSDQYADKLRYFAISSKWYRWTGDMWQVEQTLQAFDFARAICRTAAGDPKAVKIARELTKAKTVAAVEKLARADRRHATAHDEWNTDQWTFNEPVKGDWAND